MTDYFDSSILVAAICKEEPNHESCVRTWVNANRRIFLLHGVLESFASLTGGKKPHMRLTGNSAMTVLRANLEEFRAELVTFSPRETMELLLKAQASGVRGGAVYDYMHLCAARNAGADRIFTLNKRRFIAIAPDLASMIFHPMDV